jgi:hypothetical protein
MARPGKPVCDREVNLAKKKRVQINFLLHTGRSDLFIYRKRAAVYLFSILSNAPLFN